jgi:hypothetical protein
MTHHEVAQQEVVERYVRGRLGPEERRAFQEHFFACDKCFAQVQMTERFAAGLSYAAEAGLLESRPAQQATPPWLTWLKPAFLAVAAAMLLLGATAGWLSWRQMPRLREELARERQAREQSEQASRERLRQTEEQLRFEQRARAELESQLAAQPKPDDQPASGARPEPNVPVMLLEATRAASTSELAVPAGARSLLLWIEVEPGSRFSSFRLQIYTSDGRLAQTATGLRRNQQGALAVSLPAQALPPGSYLARLYGLSQQPAELVGEYRLQFRRR